MHKFYDGGAGAGDGAAVSWHSTPRQEKWSAFIGSALAAAAPRAGAAFHPRRGLSDGSINVDPLLLARLRRTRPYLPFSDLSNVVAQGGGAGIYPLDGRSSVCSFAPKPPEPAYKTPLTVAAVENRMELLDGVLVSDSAGPNWGRTSASGFAPSARSVVATDPASGHKTAICRWWAKGACRHGYKCKQAHGEDELRRTPQDLEHDRGEDELLRSAQVREPPIVGFYGSSLAARSPSLPISAAVTAVITAEDTQKEVAVELETDRCSHLDLVYLNPPESPELSLGQWPMSQADDEYATAVLYGTGARQRRLPVFEMICPQR